MAISRFEKFKPVDFNDMAIVTPDVAMLDSMLGKFQGEYDAGVSKISEANFKNLGADAMRSKELREQQYQMVDDIADKYVTGVGEGRRAMSQGLRDLTRDYKEGGERYAINKNYESFMAQREELKKRIGKSEAQGGITQAQMAAWERYTLGNYGLQGGAKADQYGIYAGINMDDVAKYVNGDLRALAIAKDWKADKFKTGQWVKKNGEIYKKTVRGEEKVEFDEVMDETLKALTRDDELVNYLKQFSQHSGQELNLSKFAVRNEDGSVSYDTSNPLVGYAMTAARKYSYLDQLYDEDIKFDQFEKQRRQWARDDEKERQANLMFNAVHLGRSTHKEDIYETGAQARKGLAQFDSQISTYEEQLKDPNLTESQRNHLQESLVKAKYNRLNLEQSYNEAIAETAPEFASILDLQKENLETAGIANSLHNTALAAVDNTLVTTSEVTMPGQYGGITKTVTTGAPLSEENLDEGAAVYAEKTGVSVEQARDILFAEIMRREMQPRVDKAVKTKIKVSKKNNMIAQPIIALDQSLKYREGAIKGAPTAVARLNNQLQLNPEGFTFEHPDVGVLQGEEFFRAMEDQFGGKFQWNKMGASDYIPGADFMHDGKELKANNKGVISVLYTDEEGHTRPMTFNAGFTKATQEFADAIEQDIMTYSVDEKSKRAIQVGHARKEKPIGAFARMETENQNKVIIPAAVQPGQSPTQVYGGIEFNVKRGNKEGKPDAYLIKVGEFEKDFGQSYMEAERWGDKMLLVSKAASQYKTTDEAVETIWSQIGAEADNPLTKKELRQVIEHFKQK